MLVKASKIRYFGIVAHTINVNFTFIEPTMSPKSKLSVNKAKTVKSKQLRKQAEELLYIQPELGETLNLKNRQELLHELSVYQIKLERQNEELQSTQQLLEDSRNRYFELYELAPVGYFMLHADNLIAEGNVAGAKLLGLPKRFINKERFSSFILKEDQALFYQHRSAVLKTNLKQSCELRLINKNHGIIYVRLDSLPVNASPYENYIWIAVTDITVNKQAEVALQESESRYRSLIELSPDGIFIACQAKIVFANEQMAELAGLHDPAKLVGQSISHIFGREFDLPHYAETNLITERWQRWDGKIGYIELKSKVIEYDKETATLVIVRDITERKQIEDDLHQRQIKLAQVAHANSMGELASALAHELNQPLTAIAAYSGGCLMQLKKVLAQTNELANAMQHIAKQSSYAGNLIHRLKDFISDGVLHFESVNLNELIHDILPLLYYETTKSAIEIELQLAEELPNISADKTQLEQVIFNLVHNSLQTFKLAQTPAPHIIIQTAWQSSSIIVSIMDNGPGFSVEVAKHLFEPYFSDSLYQGMGNSLAICKTIIEAHRGALTAPLNSEGGACLRFSLPVT
jgi:PAS domain S-box-containing protein